MRGFLRSQRLLRLARDHRGGSRVVVLAAVAVAACLTVGGWALYQSSSQAAERDRIAELLEVGPGTVVADIGGGGGEWTVDLARRVGEEGRVYSTEVDPDRLDDIREAIADAGLHNVEVVEGAQDATNLPQQCCDAILLRRVYHHFTDPHAMNRSMLASLRSGGRILVIDFEPGSMSASAPDGVPDRRGGHGTPKEQLVEEMTTNSFELVEQIDDWFGRDYAMLFRRPEMAGSERMFIADSRTAGGEYERLPAPALGELTAVRSPEEAASSLATSAPGRAVEPPSPTASRPVLQDGLYALVDAAWANDPLWDDGQAELDLYIGTLVREGVPRREAWAVHVVVKEPFTPELLVKADDPGAEGAFDVLKLNEISYARTGLYDWREMTSAFIDRSDLVPVKMVWSRQEWCGTIFKEWRRFGSERGLHVSSYFDGVGTQDLDHTIGDRVVPEDSLPVVLRALRQGTLEQGQTLDFPMVPTLSGSHAGPTEAVEATLTVGKIREVDVPLGAFEAVPISVSYLPESGSTRMRTFWIEVAAPHRVLRVEGPGEERLDLVRSERLPYWEMSGNEHPWFLSALSELPAEGR